MSQKLKQWAAGEIEEDWNVPDTVPDPEYDIQQPSEDDDCGDACKI